MTGTISTLSTVKDRDFFRVDGKIYLRVDPIDESSAAESTPSMLPPTFENEVDDYLGLAIDGFRERLLLADPPAKEWFLQIQELLALTKRFSDAMNGSAPKLFHKLAVNISGSGLSFPWQQSFDRGQKLRLSCFFPRFPYSFVCVIGEVVKSDPLADGSRNHLIKTHFCEMPQALQDEILRFVNQCQRDNLHNSST